MIGSFRVDATLTPRQVPLVGMALSGVYGLAGRTGAAEIISAGGIVIGLITGVVGDVIDTLGGAAARKAFQRFRPQPARGTVRGRGYHHGAAQILRNVS